MTATQTELTATRTFQWTEYPWFPTNRHRTPRRRDVESTATVRVPIIAAEDAPIAYRRPVSVYDSEISDYVATGPLDYRYFDGKLWTAAEIDWRDGIGQTTPATDEALASVSEGYYRIEAEYENLAVNRYLRQFPRMIAIDGLLWQVAKEPVYKINTPTGYYGGSLRIEIENRPDREDKNAAHEHYFTADQIEEAIAFASKIAADEDYTFDEQKARAFAIEVTGAHTPGSTWNPAPRLQYAMPSWNAPVSESVDQLANFRASLSLHHRDILIKTDDGFGNTYMTVDRSKLSHTQAYHYDKLLEQAGDPAATPKR